MTGNLCSHNRTLTPRTQPAIGFFAAGSGGGSARAIMLSAEQSVDWKTKDRSAFATFVLRCVSFAFVSLTCRTAMTLGRRTAAQVHYARRASTSGATLHLLDHSSAALRHSHDWQALKRKIRILIRRGSIVRRSGALMCVTRTSW